MNLIGLYFHITFFILGLVTLVYMTLNTDNKKLYLLLLSTSLLFVALSQNSIYSFYFLSSVFLIYMVSHYFTNYIKNRQPKTILISIAFFFFLLGNIHFIFLINHIKFYIIGHFLGLIAYLLIFANLLLVLKNDKKKK